MNAGYFYNGTPGFIYIPEFGFTPANPGLRALHQWRVVQDGRLYYYYSPNYRVLGPGYTYDGIRGYMYDPFQNEATVPNIGGGSATLPMYKVKSCYSQTYGYWYGAFWPITFNPPTVYQLESPPTGTFNCGPEHEIIGGGIFTTRGTGPDAVPQIPEGNPSARRSGDKRSDPVEPFNSPS